MSSLQKPIMKSPLCTSLRKSSPTTFTICRKFPAKADINTCSFSLFGYGYLSLICRSSSMLIFATKLEVTCRCLAKLEVGRFLALGFFCIAILWLSWLVSPYFHKTESLGSQGTGNLMIREITTLFLVELAYVKTRINREILGALCK